MGAGPGAQIGLDPVPGAQHLRPETAYLSPCQSPSVTLALSKLEILVGRNDPPQISVDLDLSAYDKNTPSLISRHHALLQWVSGQLEVIDLGSRNGTFVDGERLQSSTPNTPSPPKPLQVGTRLRFADTEFEVISRG
jgi:pSer/pThr/pTyr-binding forkhead associated (FHA) protein